MKKNRAKSYGRNATIETLQLLSCKLLAITQTQDVGDDAIGIIISRTCRNVR